MKLKLLKNVFFILGITAGLLMISSFYNFVSGFSIISTVKTKRYNARRAHYYGMLEESSEFFKLKTDDNINLTGLIIDRPASSSVLLVCHGYKQSKEHLVAIANLFKDYTVVLFDLRAHGDSEGSFVSFGYHEHLDVAAVLNFLKNDDRFSNKNIYGLGVSMGAASLAKAAASGCEFDALILDSCFSVIDYDVVTKFIPIPRFFYQIGKRLFHYCWGVDIDSIRPGIFLSSIQCPILILHSDKDDKISISHAHTIYGNLSCVNKKLVICKGAHGQLFKDDAVQYQEVISDFLVRL